MPRLDESYPAMVAALAAELGEPNPPDVLGDGAVLTAFLAVSLDKRRLPAAREALRDAGLLDCESLAAADPAEVRAALSQRRITATPKTVKVLRELARWQSEHGSIEDLANVPTDQLREELRAINGVGPATADAILLYGLGRAAYPLDRATYRILVRHGWLDTSADYDEARALVERREPDDARALIRLAYWFERVGALACRPSVAHCDRCPLRPWLPEGGPIEPSEG